MKFLKIILFSLIILSPLAGRAQPRFIAVNPREACDSLTVTFVYFNTDIIDTVKLVEWDFGNGKTATGETNQKVLYDSVGIYTVSILVNGTTKITEEDYITIHPTPNSSFFYSDSLELGSFTVVFESLRQFMDSLFAYQWEWQFEDGGTGNTRKLTHSFPAEGTYRADLIVTNPLGCADSSFSLVQVNDLLEVPNVFSPNDDGINDYFIARTNGVTRYSVQIFSKSGILVYKSETPSIIWDGKNLSGQEMSQGTYFYVIKPVVGTNQFEKSGFINLFR